MNLRSFTVLSSLCLAASAFAADAGLSRPVYGGATAQPAQSGAGASRAATATATAPAATPTRHGSYGGSSYRFSDSDSGEFFDTWISGRLSIGLTYSIFSLSDGDRPANRDEDFLGYINELNDSHDSRIVPILEYKVCDYVSVGLTYMQIEASTMNFNNGEGDGNAVMKGPVIGAELTYPLWENRLFPHIGGGIAFLSGDFDEDTWWRLGYSSPESWEEYGRPSQKTRFNRYRYIDVDDETKAFFAIGLSCRPHPHVKLDISYRKISLDPHCEFGYDYGPAKGKSKQSEGDFDLSGGFWLFSVSYIF